MNFKRSNYYIVVFLILGLFLVACGGGDTPAEPTEAAEPAETEAEEPNAEEVVEEAAPEGDMGDEAAIRWRTRPGDDAEAAVYQSINDEVVAGFVDFPTEYEAGALDNYVDVLNTELASGTAPDVFWIPGVNVADFATRGVLLDMRELANADSDYSDEDFYPGPMFHLAFDPESGSSGPVLWGLPRDASAFALYLNLDLIAEAGASDPRELVANGEWNWDGFLEVATAVSSLGDDIFGYAEDAWWGPYGYWMGAGGGGFFTEDLSGCNLNSADTLAGLDFQRRLYQDFEVAVPWGESGDPPFLAGNVAMRLNGRWATPGFRSGADFNWDTVGLPDGPGGPSNWHFWGAYVVNADTADPQKAWELVRALTSTEAQLEVSQLGANIPSRRSQAALDAFLGFSPPDNNQAFLDGLANNPQTEGPLWNGSWPEYAAVMDPAIGAVLNGELSVDDFAATICDEANKAFTDGAAVIAPDDTTAVEETDEEMVDVNIRWRTRPGDDAEAAVYQSINDDVVAGLVNFTTEYEPGALDNYVDVLNTELASGTAPDVFWIPGVNVADFAARGVLLDMRPLADATNGYSDDDFYSGPMFHLAFDPESGSSGPVLWGLPRDASAFALYLNLDLIEEAGAPDPRELAANGEWNWDGFLEVATAVSSLGDDVFGFAEDAWWGPYGYWMGAAGGGFFTEDRTGCNLAAAETVAGLDFQRRLYQDFEVAVPWGESGDPPFLAGNVAMRLNGRWATPGFRAGADFNWDVVELPDGPGGPSNWHFWGAYVVNADTDNPQQAWELLLALTSIDAQLKVSELGANIPSRRGQDALDAFLTFSPPANNQAFLNGLANNPLTEGPLWAGSWPEYAAVMDPAIGAVLNGELSVDDFAATICDEANKAFSN